MTGTINFSQLASGVPALNDPIPFWSTADAISQRTTRATLQGQINPNVFNVADYGAIPYDNSSAPFNCHDAIGRAVAAAQSAGGGIVYFPALYAAWVTDRSTVVLITGSNITLMGGGFQTGIICPFLPSPVFPFAIVGRTVAAYAFAMENMSLYGSNVVADQDIGNNAIIRGIATVNSSGNGDGTGSNVGDLYFHRVHLGAWNSGSTPTYGIALGVGLQDTAGVVFDDCIFENFVGLIAGFGYGVIAAGSDYVVQNCRFKPLIASSGRHGFYCAFPVNGLKVINNWFENIRHEAITSNTGTLNGASGLLIQGNYIYNCSDATATPLAGAIYIAGFNNFQILANIIFNDDTVNWGSDAGIIMEQDGALLNNNYNGIIANNLIVGVQSNGIDVASSHNMIVTGNILQDVGLNGGGGSGAIHTGIPSSQLVSHISIYGNRTVISAGGFLSFNVGIDTTNPPGTQYVYAYHNEVNIGAGATLGNELLTTQASAPGYFRSGITPMTGRVLFDDTTTPNIQSTLPFFRSAAAVYLDQTDFLNPQDGQLFYELATTLPIRVKNGGRIINSNGADYDVNAGKMVGYRYDANNNAFYDVFHPADLEIATQPTNGRWQPGQRAWNSNPTRNGYAGWIPMNDGTALVTADQWPLTAASGHAVNGTTRCWNGVNAYLAASTGTCGGTPPTWTTGTQTDGGVLWTYVGLRSIFSAFGPEFRTIRNFTSGSHGLQPTDKTILCDTTSGDVLLNLGDASVCDGDPVFVRKIAGGNNVIVAAGTGGQTVEGSASPYTLTALGAAISPNGSTDWRFVSAMVALP